MSAYTVHKHDEDLLLFVVCRSTRAGRQILPRVTPDYFQSRSHQRVWKAYRAAFKQPDCTWYDEHEVRRQLAQVGGRDEDYDLVEDVEQSDVQVRQKPSELIDRLRYNKLRREIWDEDLQTLTTMLASGAGNADALHTQLSEMCRQVRPYTRGRTGVDAFEEFGRWRSREHAQIKIGIEPLDEQLRLGLMVGDQTTLAGATSVGKTRLVNYLSDRLAGQGHKVAAFCWEVSRARTIAQYVALRTEYSYEEVCFSRVPEVTRIVSEVAEQVTNEIEFFDRGQIIDVKHKCSRTASGNRDMVDLVYGLAADAGCVVAVFDLMSKVFPSSRPDDVAEALDHARDWEAPFHSFYIHQLSMKSLTGHESHAELGDLIGAQGWVNIPDNVLTLRRFIEQDETMDAPGPPRDVLEVKCQKQRWGPKGWCVLADFLGERGSFENWRTPDPTQIQSPKQAKRTSGRRR